MRSARARCRSTSRTSPSCSSETATGSPSRWTRARSLDGADFLFVCVDTPPTYSGDADLSRGLDRGRRAAAARGAHRPRDEVHRAGRDGREGAGRRSTHAGLTHVGYVSNPEFLAEGSGRARLHEPRPDRRSAPSRRPTATLSRPCTTESTPPVVRCDVELGRDDQARRERVPDDADQLHQRDRQRLRADGRRRRRRSPRASASTTASGRTSCGPGSATAAPASRRTRSRSSSSRRTPATTSSC